MPSPRQTFQNIPLMKGSKSVSRAYKIAAVLAAVFTFTPSAILAGPDANGVLFVNKANTGGDQSGDSWTNAIPELGTALDMAKSLTAGTVSQIWVAQGTYAPTTMPSDLPPIGTTLTERDKTFVLLKDVSIYGGFDGTETTIWERTLPNTATVLTGDLTDSSQNAYHVVVSAGNVGSARLDRLTISGGRADYYEPYDPDAPLPLPHSSIFINDEPVERTYAAGLYIINGSPTINHVLLTDNFSFGDGAAFYIESSSAKINNITISNNTGEGYGTAFEIWDSNIAITNALITGNLGYAYGCAIDVNRSNVTLTNVTVVGNRGTGSNSAAIYSNHSSSTVAFHNCIIAENLQGDGNESNTATSDNGILTYRSSIIGNKFYDATGTAQTPSNLALADLFVDPEPAAAAPTDAGDYRLKEDSYAIDAGDDTFFDPGQTPDLSDITADLDQNIRIIPPAIDLGPFEFGSTAGVVAWSLY